MFAVAPRDGTERAREICARVREYVTLTLPCTPFDPPLPPNPAAAARTPPLIVPSTPLFFPASSCQASKAPESKDAPRYKLQSEAAGGASTQRGSAAIRSRRPGKHDDDDDVRARDRELS
jgi:hypothetical protein